MINFTYNLILSAVNHTPFWLGSLIICALNMTVQILFDIIFGYKGNSKIRGWRGE